MEKVHNDIDIIALPKQEIQAKINKEQKYIGSMKHQAGHTLFEINHNTKQIREAVIERKVFIGLDGKPIFQRKVQINKDCYYIEALNAKNALKKYQKINN